MEEIDLILSIINKKERFVFFNHNTSILLFDGYTFSLYELSKNFYIENNTLKNDRKEINDIVFLHDIISIFPKFENKKPLLKLEKFSLLKTNFLEENFISKDKKILIQSLDKTFIKYLLKILSKSFTSKVDNNNCFCCPWGWLCEYNYDFSDCSENIDLFFQKILLFIFMYRSKNTKESLNEIINTLKMY